MGATTSTDQTLWSMLDCRSIMAVGFPIISPGRYSRHSRSGGLQVESGPNTCKEHKESLRDTIHTISSVVACNLPASYLQHHVPGLAEEQPTRHSANWELGWFYGKNIHSKASGHIQCLFTLHSFTSPLAEAVLIGCTNLEFVISR